MFHTRFNFSRERGKVSSLKKVQNVLDSDTIGMLVQCINFHRLGSCEDNASFLDKHGMRISTWKITSKENIKVLIVVQVHKQGTIERYI